MVQLVIRRKTFIRSFGESDFMPDAPVHPDLRVSCVTDWSATSDLAADWNRLAGEVPFRRWEWVDSWWRHYRRPGWTPYILTVTHGEAGLVGVLPCYWANSPVKGRVLRLMGSGEICSDYLTLLAAPNSEQAVARSVGRWLSESAVGDWAMFELECVDASDETWQALIHCLRGQGHRVYSRPRPSTWRIALPATWDEFLAKVSRGRRVKMRQIVKRQFETGQAVGRIVKTSEDFDRGWKVLCDLHQRRRESLGEKGCFASDRFAGFHTEVSRRFFEMGRLRLHWVELNGTPIAVDYAFTGEQTVFCYQSGIDPRFLDAQPGWLDWTSSVRLAIEEGYQGFDFLRGDEKYKATWRAEPRSMLEYRVVGRRPADLLRDHLWNAGVSAKTVLGAATRSVRQWLPGGGIRPTVEADEDVQSAT